MDRIARVSVIIPTYERPRELGFALNSLAAEASVIHEVVIVDDASPEPLVVDPPAELAGRTRLIRLPSNRGAAGARQAGIQAATGDVIAFLDSDDAWLAGKLAAQLPLLTDDPMVAVVCGWQVIDLASGRQWTRVPVTADTASTFAAGCWFCPGTTAVVRREAFARVGGLDTELRRLEDLDWFLRFALAGGRVVVAPMIGALVRRAARQNHPLVAAAAQRIRGRFAADRRVDAATARHLDAWLDVELAFANWTEGRRLLALADLARSQLRAPRPRLQLRKWWRQGPPLLDPSEAMARLGIAVSP